MATNTFPDYARELSYNTSFSGSSLLPMLLLSLTMQRSTPRIKQNIRREYDYIIVGGGPAGAVVASRLSEMYCVDVLLLEAGDTPPLLVDVPAIAREFIGSDLDWKFSTTPQGCAGGAFINRQIAFPKGKMVGGTSGLSAMFDIRGNPRGYDDWAARGARGWSYREVLPYFIKLEEYTDPRNSQNGYHGIYGPVTISKPTYNPVQKRACIDAASSLGYSFIDINGPYQNGFFDIDATIRNGQRCSAAKAYLVPSDYRQNLDIVSGVMVMKILIEPINRVAVGVDFVRNGIRQSVRARREVILSAGTINTAQLLMLSGIGPRSELNRLGIPVIADLPVGLNLQNPPISFMSYEINGAIRSFGEEKKDDVNIRNYINCRQGPLTSTEGIFQLATLSMNGTDPAINIPDYLLYFFEILDESVQKLGLTQNVLQQYFGPYANRRNMVCAVQALHPRSTGRVTLQSRDPFASVVIDPNYYADPRDLDDVVQGLKFCNRFMATPAMRSIGATPFQTIMPGCEPYVGNEDSYLRCLAKALVYASNNFVGTAKMGDPNDPSTVVDPQLRVKTIKNLRVVGSSIMPTPPWGGGEVPTYMVGEKASDMIKSTIIC